MRLPTRVAARLGVGCCVAAIHLAIMPAPAGAAPPSPHSLFGECARCHTPHGWKQLKRGAGGAIDHARTGFRLAGRHAQLACTDCHGPTRRPDDPWRGACVACHADTHHREALGRDCARCHTDRTWRVPGGRELHARTRFPLTGAHLAADCTSCHLRADQGQYTDAPVACAACHLAAYQRPDTHPPHVAGGFSTDCALCHRTASFRPARFLHANFFPLDGAHARATCEDCHKNGRFGGTPSACEACHGDAWATAMNPNHADAGFSKDCAGCHTTQAWRPARPDWHNRVFPITTGHHRGVSCAQCHVVPSDYKVFRCTQCHTADQVIPEHRDVGGFVFEDHACYQCHPRG